MTEGASTAGRGGALTTLTGGIVCVLHRVVVAGRLTASAFDMRLVGGSESEVECRVMLVGG